MTFTSTYPIYIGYEEREHEAFEVCKFSMEINSIFDLDIRALKSQDIPEYNRNFGEPQSTDFTFTRFWVPYLCGYKGFSIFVDCDFLFLDDPDNLFDYVDKTKAVSVVQHPQYVPLGDFKMDNISQHRSKRKNWCSLMVFNNEHPACKSLTPEYLNNHPQGIDFHWLKWVDDEDIGSIPLEWNVLDQYYHLLRPKAIHYTEGGPWFGSEFMNTRYADEWLKYQTMMNRPGDVDE